MFRKVEEEIALSIKFIKNIFSKVSLQVDDIIILLQLRHDYHSKYVLNGESGCCLAHFICLFVIILTKLGQNPSNFRYLANQSCNQTIGFIAFTSTIIITLINMVPNEI